MGLAAEWVRHRLNDLWAVVLSILQHHRDLRVMRTTVLGHPTKCISRTEDQMGVGHNPYSHSIRRCPDYDKLEKIRKIRKITCAG